MAWQCQPPNWWLPASALPTVQNSITQVWEEGAHDSIIMDARQIDTPEALMSWPQERPVSG